MSKAEYRSAVRSRRMIFEALVGLLKEKPLEKITVTDVITRAGLNRGTFYAHYTDIPDVLNRQVAETCQCLREVIQSRPSKKPDPDPVLRALQAMVEQDVELFRSIFNSSLAAPILATIRNFCVDSILEKGSGEPVRKQEQYAFLVRLGSGGVVALYQDWFAGKLPMSLSELTQAACKYLRQQIEAA